MSKELYVYSTEKYLRHGLVKVGECEKGRHKIRIREQFGTANPELPIHLWVKDLPDGITDHKIHHQLKKNGIKKEDQGAGNEWFYAEVKDVKLAYNQVVFGKNRTENYSPRKEQKEAIDKAKKWFDKDYSEDVLGSATHQDRFLLNAKMRFGKCFTGLHIARAIKAKNTIIVTYKPEVIGEWLEATNDHVDFDGWMGIRAKQKDRNSVEPCLTSKGEFPTFNGSKVLCVSLQDLAIDEHGKTKLRLEKVLDIDWDLIIFDEVHYGSRTDRAKHIISQLKIKHRLDLSGTPFRLIQEDDFCPQQVFTYSYLDEKKNKETEIANDPTGEGVKIYRQMPDLNICTIDVTEADIQQQKEAFITDDLDFSLNELFKANNTGFVHDEAVNHFLDGLTKSGHDARSISVFGELGKKLGTPPQRHSVWWLKEVAPCRALVKKMKKHPYFSNFEIINAAGSKGAGGDEDQIIAKDKSSVEKAIKKVKEDSSKLGTITLTCRRFLTGVTIKEWDSILVLNDVQSAESYYQAIFRVQSAWVNKKTRDIVKPQSWCFDFAISRCLRITYEYANALADQLDQQASYEKKTDLNNDNLTSTVQGLCDSLCIKRFYEGSLKSDSTSARDVFEALNFEGSKIALAKRITSDVLVNFSSLKLLDEHPHLYEIIKKIKGYRTQEVGSIDDFVQIGLGADKIGKGKESKSEDEIEKDNEDFVEKEKNKEVQTRKKWYATQIKRLAICMADFIYMTYVREFNINHVINTKESHFFEVMTGISKEDFNELCHRGFINTLALNRIVREFKNQEETSLKPEEYILENLTKRAS